MTDRNRNPYEPPRCDLDENLASETPDGEVRYRSIASRLEWDELWKISPNVLVFLVLAVRKLMGVKGRADLAFGAGRPRPAAEYERFGPEIRAALEAFAARATEQGLRFVCVVESPMIGVAEAGSNVHVDAAGRTLVGYSLNRVRRPRGATDQAYLACYSSLADGRVVVTSGNRKQLRACPEYLTEYLPDATVRELLDRHERRLAEFGDSVVPAPTLDEQVARVRRFDRRRIEFYLTRGVYQPADSRDLEQCARARAALDDPALRANRSIAPASWFFGMVAVLYLAASGRVDDEWLVVIAYAGLVLVGLILVQKTASWLSARRRTTRGDSSPPR